MVSGETIRAALIVNESARGVSRGFDGTRAADYLRSRGVDTRLVFPETGSGATLRAREAAERGDDLLFVAGGDGSLRDAALGISGTETALAPIPMGTVNVFAREIGIPKDPYRAIDAHLDGQRVRMDLGWATGVPDGPSLCFLLMASAGWDAEIARSVNPTLKKHMGDAAYVLRTVSVLPGLRPVQARWRIDAQLFDDPLALIVMQNTRLYGGMFKLAPGALADDGLLDIVALTPQNVIDGTRLAAKLATGHLSGDARVLEYRGSEVFIETPGIPVQLDGDFAGETPMRFDVHPRALLVSLPAGPLPGILGGPGGDSA